MDNNLLKIYNSKIRSFDEEPKLDGEIYVRISGDKEEFFLHNNGENKKILTRQLIAD